jgi:hypothetical protein
MTDLTGFRARSGVIILTILANLVLAGVAGAKAHKDEKHGFSIQPPKKWQSIPVSADEPFIVAKFHAERDYWPKRNFGISSRPVLKVVLIPLGKGPHVVRRQLGGREVKIPNPYKDFRAYLEANAKGMFDRGGFFFSAEKETKLRGVRVIQYEITFDKLADCPRRVFGWAFYGEDCIYGVMGDCLIEWEKKLKPKILASMKSLRLIDRTGRLPWEVDDRTTAEPADRKDQILDEDLTDAEFKTRRDARFETELKRIKEGLPKGWRVCKSKNFVAVTHADPRYTKKLLAHAEALRAWLDTKLGFIGSGYTGKVIIRICGDEQESSGYRDTLGWFSFGRIEVVTYKDKEGWGDWAMESLNRGIYNIWLREKNPQISRYAPSWLTTGLSGVVEDAKTKRGKVVFDGDTWDSVRMKELRRAGKLIPVRDFFDCSQEDLRSRDSYWGQSEAFVRFLLIGSGSKSPRFSPILPTYLKNLLFLVDEAAEGDSEFRKLIDKEPESEEEEDKLMRERSAAWNRDEKNRLTALHDRTFEGWTDSDWMKLDVAYLREVK